MSIFPIQETETNIETILYGFLDDTSIFVTLLFQEKNQETII